MQPKKLSKQQLHKQQEIEESKTLTLDSLFITEGQIKLKMKKLSEEKATVERNFNYEARVLREKLAKAKRLINYKRMALQK